MTFIELIGNYMPSLRNKYVELESIQNVFSLSRFEIIAKLVRTLKNSANKWLNFVNLI